MASSQNVELEAAKFLQKLIQESKDEPAKLATKLYVILQHMKSSGKEHSMPYQVISRAMETVISQHGLDIEALKSSRLPLSGGPQTGDSSASKHTEPLQPAGISTSTNAVMAEHDMSKSSIFASGRAVAGPSSGGHEYYQGSLTHRSNQSFNQESPSSLETRSANSQSQERRDSASYAKQGNQKDSKKTDSKRKRGDSSTVMEPHAENLQKLDNNSLANPRKGKTSKVDTTGVPFRGADHANFNIAQSVQMEHLPSSLRLKQEDQIQHSSSLCENHDLATKIHEQRSIDPFGVASSSTFEPSDDGRNAIIQETRVPRNAAVRDAGKSLVSRASAVPGTPFNEQQLKQLRAQCLVFLAFRNGLTPKPLHLEIALGNILPREGSALGGLRQELDQKGTSQPSNEPKGSIPATHSSAIEAKGPTMLENNRNDGIELQSQTTEPQAILPSELKYLNSPSTVNQAGGNGPGSLGRENIQRVKTNLASLQSVMNQHVNFETFKHSSFGNISEAPGGSLISSAVREHWKPVSGSSAEHRIVTGMDYNEIPKEVPHEKATDEEGEDESASIFLPPPKYTMLERWVMDQQKRKFLVEQNQLLKQQRTEQRISRCFDRLKKTVSVSEDISAKTRSVIELKKLQLLALQRRLRSDFLGDFFKPIVTEMDHLRSFKKHRHGRRIKQIEKYEQKMKEERQKRIRERQKEFFSDIEVHRERLEDVFKAKRERLKGFNKYVKELHKRKERTHREKIDRIQREKITLLKINDVEGYLRMVQDAKSDRVKQLLKETEKYLQKLGSRLQEAKAVSRSSEHDADEMQTASFLENSETLAENDDENDQAKHYKESNEKYYLMAHSIKESIAEQPTMLHGGKLREYQMNGLRWLVSLYNNHLNGILADEMGLGKTVQVISLICYLMETKNDRGPFLVVVPSSVLPGWESEINFWAPAVHKIVYAGPPEERRRMFKEKIVHQKFNVLLTTYEYLMNKHDRPKLSKLHWHYIIIDEGHRIKNASCKLNADLKHYRSSHRLLLTGTPLQNNLEELWALLNFLLPNIFNSSENFSQWFNKPFESNGDSSAEEALLSEEENLLIINRLHQVLRPFVLRRLKHKVENELPEKIERLVRCEPSAYQKLLMKRVEENLGSLGTSKGRSVQNSVMELRNICNHPYLSQLHAEEVDNLIPKHYLPPIVRLCGKLEMLDRLLPKLKATDHRVLFFSTMTRLLDVMEEYLNLKHYRYLRLDGHTSGGDRGALIESFNQPNSPFFIFLLSIRAGGVGVNLQAADTVIIFDTDWNPQVDLQAQARAHRIGQKKDVLVLRFETVQTVEEQVRAAAEHKLGVANQSITAGFFDNNTSAEDRREYLESLLRECKKEEAAPVLDDDALNYLIARSESEIDIFESVDRKRREDEMVMWSKLVQAQGKDVSKPLHPLPPRLVTHEDLKMFCEVMKVFETPKTGPASNIGVKRKSEYGGLDTQHYGRGKRAREVRSYEEQMTEEEFERMCQAESPGSPNQEDRTYLPIKAIEPVTVSKHVESSTSASMVPPPVPSTNQAMPPAKRGRGRPKRAVANISPPVPAQQSPGTSQVNSEPQKGTISSSQATSALNPSQALTSPEGSAMAAPNNAVAVVTPTVQPNPPTASPASGSESVVAGPPVPTQEKGHRRKTRIQAPQDVITTHTIAGLTSNSQPSPSLASSTSDSPSTTVLASSSPPTQERGQRRRVQIRAEPPLENVGITAQHPNEVASKAQLSPALASPTTASQPGLIDTVHAIQEKPVATQERGRRRKTQSPMIQSPVEAPRRRGRRKISATDVTSADTVQDPKLPEQNRPINSLGVEAAAATGSTGSTIVLVPESTSAGNPGAIVAGKEVDYPQGSVEGARERVCGLPAPHASIQDSKSVVSDNSTRGKQSTNSKIGHNVRFVASMMKEILSASKTKVSERSEGDIRDSPPLSVTGSTSTEVTGGKHSEDMCLSTSVVPSTVVNPPSGSKDNQSRGEPAAVHEKVDRKMALPFPKQVIEENLEEMPAVPPGFETPKRLLPQNQGGESSDHVATNVPSMPPLSINVADDVKISASSCSNLNSATAGIEAVTLEADGKSIEVIDGVMNQDLSPKVDLGKDSSNNFTLESKTDDIHAATSVEQNDDDPCARVPASDGKGQVHHTAPEEAHGGIQQVPKDESTDVNLDHDVMEQNDEEKVPSQQDLTNVLPTREDEIDESAKTSSDQERDSAGQQPQYVENSGAETAELHCKSSSPEFHAVQPESVDKLANMDANLTKEKGAANSPTEVAKSGKDDEETSHQIDFSSHNSGISVDTKESSEIADQRAASSLVAHEEKREGSVDKGDIVSLLCEEGCQMDGSQANPETANKVSENVTEKLTSLPLTAEGKKNDCSMDGGAGGNLIHEMGAQMDVFEKSNLEVEALPDEPVDNRDSKFIASGPDSLNMVQAENRDNILEVEEKKLAASPDSTVSGGSPMQALGTDPQDEVKPNPINDVEDTMEQSEHHDNCVFSDSLDEGKSKPVKDVEDMMEEQLDHPDDAARDNSLDEAKPDTINVACGAKDVQLQLPESCAVATESNFTAPEPGLLMEPNPVTSNDVCAALGEQLPLSDAAVVAEESSLPVPTADFVTETIQQSTEEAPMDMKNQSPANLTVAGDAQVHNSVAESPDEVELETSPVDLAIQDPQENSSSDQANEKTERPEVSAGAVPSAADVTRYDVQVEVKPESFPASHALAELQGYASPEESSEVSDHTNLSRSESVPEMNEASELAEAPMEESTVAEQSKLVPEVDFPAEVKFGTAPAYHASHGLQQIVASDHNDEEPFPANIPECELGSSMSVVREPTEQLTPAEGSADVGQSKFDVPEAIMQEKVISETAQTDNAIPVLEELAGPSQASEEALKTVLPGLNVGSDVIEACVPVEHQSATPNDSPAAGESMSDMPVADLHDKATPEKLPIGLGAHEQPNDISTDPVDEKAHHGIPPWCNLGSTTGQVCELVGERLALQEDSVGVETSRLDGDGAAVHDRMVTDEQSLVREHSVVPVAELQVEGKPETENAVCEIVKEQPVLLEDSVVPGKLNSAASGTGSPDEVKTETVSDVLETVEEHSIAGDDSAVPGELNPASAVESGDDVQPHNMKEISETTKEQSSLLEDSVIAEEPPCDAVGDKSIDEVEKMEIDGVCETVKEQQQMIQAGDSMVSGESRLAVPEATSQDEVETMEVDNDCEMVKDQQQKMIQPGDSMVSGESRLAVPEATSQEEVETMEVDNVCEMVKDQQQMIQAEDSMVLGEFKLAGSEATSQDKVETTEEVCETVKEQQQMTQPEDSTVSGESKLAESEATSKDKVEAVEEVTVKEQQQMTQPEDPTVSGESKVAVSEATLKNEVEKMEVVEVCETVKEQQPIAEPGDISVSGEPTHAVPEATSQSEVEKEQQPITQPEDISVSGEPTQAVPEATSQSEVEKEQQPITQPEDISVSGESTQAVPEATSQNEIKSETMEEKSDA